MVKTAKAKTKFKRHHKVEEGEDQSQGDVLGSEDERPTDSPEAYSKPEPELDIELPYELMPTPEVPAEEVDEEAGEKVSNSIVADKFKKNYIENARAQGLKGKAPRRSNWDWLAQEIARECLNEKHKIDIVKFMDILRMNGIDHSKWPNRTKGWEGRLRMTGRVALQRIVADTGVLKFPVGSDSVPPPEFVARYKTKA